MTFPAVQNVLQIWPVSIHWYGLLVVGGMCFGYLVVRYLNSKSSHPYRLSTIDSLVFSLITWGFVGARLYHVLNESGYYWDHPVDIFKVWNGGLAIHGALLAGVLVIWYFSIRHPELDSGSRKENKSKQAVIASEVVTSVAISNVDHRQNEIASSKTPRNDKIRNLFVLSDLLVIGLALGQSIGRWGNYFNQELFGKPTNGFFKVFIDAANRPVGFENIVYYHPTFFYESVLNLTLFIVLFLLFRKLYIVKTEKKWLVASDQWLENQSNQKLLTTHYSLLTCLYLVGYGLVRFFIDFLRIDPRPFFGGLYLSQWVSIAMIVIGVVIWYNKKKFNSIS